jgi:hypothetical protein
VKKLGFTILAAAALALPLSAQVAAETVNIDIPFEFVVGTTTAPAGTYVFSSPAGKPMVRMQLVGTEGSFLLTNPESVYKSPQVPKLIFHRYGNQYFLSWIGTTSTSRDIPMSRLEREAKKTTVAAARQMQTEIVLATR